MAEQVVNRYLKLFVAILTFGIIVTLLSCTYLALQEVSLHESLQNRIEKIENLHHIKKLLGDDEIKLKARISAIQAELSEEIETYERDVEQFKNQLKKFKGELEEEVEVEPTQATYLFGMKLKRSFNEAFCTKLEL